MAISQDDRISVLRRGELRQKEGWGFGGGAEAFLRGLTGQISLTDTTTTLTGNAVTSNRNYSVWSTSNS